MEKSYEEMRNKIGSAFDKWYRGADKKDEDDKSDCPCTINSCWIKDTYEDYVIVEKDGNTYKVGYSKTSDGYEFDDEKKWEKGTMQFSKEDKDYDTAKKIIEEEDDED